MKNNEVLRFNRDDYKPAKKVIHGITKCSNLFDPVKTEPQKTINTTYNKIYGQDVPPTTNRNINKEKKKPRTVKPNEIEMSMRNYKVPQRHKHNKDKFEKNFKPYSLQISKVNKNLNENDIRRKLNKDGVQPTKLKLNKNTLNHQHDGKGVIVLDVSNPEKKFKVKETLKKMDIDATTVRNFNSMIK